jgi:hypothetical protein
MADTSVASTNKFSREATLILPSASQPLQRSSRFEVPGAITRSQSVEYQRAVVVCEPQILIFDAVSHRSHHHWLRSISARRLDQSERKARVSASRSAFCMHSLLKKRRQRLRRQARSRELTRYRGNSDSDRSGRVSSRLNNATMPRGLRSTMTS